MSEHEKITLKEFIKCKYTNFINSIENECVNKEKLIPYKQKNEIEIINFILSSLLPFQNNIDVIITFLNNEIQLTEQGKLICKNYFNMFIQIVNSV